MRWRFALAMVRREARASAARLGLFGVCMGLGVAGLVGLHGVRSSARHALEARAQEIFGADLRLASREPFAEADLVRVAELESTANTRSASVTRFGSLNPSACHSKQPRTAHAKMPGISARSLSGSVLSISDDEIVTLKGIIFKRRQIA